MSWTKLELQLLSIVIIINSHILAGIYLIFLKIFLNQTGRSFKTEFGPHQKYRKGSYQVRQKFSTFFATELL